MNRHKVPSFPKNNKWESNFKNIIFQTNLPACIANPNLRILNLTDLLIQSENHAKL